ncbi:MAG: hypothetical protein ACNA8W_20570 [Bradymonadaceae bacterium]
MRGFFDGIVFYEPFAAGFNGEEIEPSRIWEDLRRLGERAADDPRFPVGRTSRAR